MGWLGGGGLRGISKKANHLANEEKRRRVRVCRLGVGWLGRGGLWGINKTRNHRANEERKRRVWLGWLGMGGLRGINTKAKLNGLHKRDGHILP